MKEEYTHFIFHKQNSTFVLFGKAVMYIKVFVCLKVNRALECNRTLSFSERVIKHLQ